MDENNLLVMVKNCFNARFHVCSSKASNTQFLGTNFGKSLVLANKLTAAKFCPKPASRPKVDDQALMKAVLVIKCESKANAWLKDNVSLTFIDTDDHSLFIEDLGKSCNLKQKNWYRYQDRNRSI